VNVNVLEAAIDDGMLYQPFPVLRFQISATDNTNLSVLESSDGARFSERQKNLIRGLPRGKMVYIRGIEVRSPAGDERTISPLEIIIN